MDHGIYPSTCQAPPFPFVGSILLSLLQVVQSSSWSPSSMAACTRHALASFQFTVQLSLCVTWHRSSLSQSAQLTRLLPLCQWCISAGAQRFSDYWKRETLWRKKINKSAVALLLVFPFPLLDHHWCGCCFWAARPLSRESGSARAPVYWTTGPWWCQRAQHKQCGEILAHRWCRSPVQSEWPCDSGFSQKHPLNLGIESSTASSLCWAFVLLDTLLDSGVTSSLWSISSASHTRSLRLWSAV